MVTVSPPIVTSVIVTSRSIVGAKEATDMAGDGFIEDVRTAPLPLRDKWIRSGANLLGLSPADEKLAQDDAVDLDLWNSRPLPEFRLHFFFFLGIDDNTEGENLVPRAPGGDIRAWGV